MGHVLDFSTTSLLIGGLEDGALETHLGGHGETLVGGSTTSQQGIFSVEMLGNFFQRSVSRLDVEDVDHDKFDGEPDAVDNVVLPADVSQGDWVDVLVEEEGGVDHEEHDGHTLSTDVVREDFDGVANQHTGPSPVVEEVVDVDEADDGVGGTSGAGDGEAGRADGPADEGDEHTGGGEEEELATTDLVDEEAGEDGDEEVEDLEDTVDQVLGQGVGVANLIQDLGDVVRDETVAGPL